MCWRPSCAGSRPCLACAAARCRWESGRMSSLRLMFQYVSTFLVLNVLRLFQKLIFDPILKGFSMPHAFVPSVPTFFSVYSPTAECYGVFAQYRFRCVLGEPGPFREGTGFREPVPVPGIRPRFRRFRCSMGSDRLGSVPEVWTEPVLGTGFWEPEVLRRFRVPEIPFPRFRKLFLTSLCFDVLWKYILSGQFASNLQSLVRITDCARTVYCFWGWTD